MKNKETWNEENKLKLPAMRCPLSIVHYQLYFALFLLFFSYPLLLSAQSKIDSLYTVLKTEKEDTNKALTLNMLSVSIRKTGNYAKADSLCRAALKLSDKLAYKSGLAKAHQNIGTIYYNQGNFPPALKELQQSLELFKQVGDIKDLNAVYTSIGNTYEAQGNYPDALKNYLQSLKIDEAQHYKKGIGADLGNIGNIYYYEGNYDEALNNYTQNLNIDKEINNKEGLGADYADLGIIYLAKKEYQKAIDNYLICLSIHKDLNDQRNVGYAYGSIGSIYEAWGKYPEALKYLQMGIDIDRKLGNIDELGVAYSNISTLYNKEQNHAKAKSYMDSALAIAKKVGDKESSGNCYFNMAIIDSSMGNYSQAYQDYKNYILYRDSITNEANTKKLVSEQMQYEFDKKEAAQQAEQAKKDAVTEATRKKQDIIILLISLGLLLVIVFSGLLFNRFRITQRQKKIIQEQKKVVEEQKAIVEEKNKDITDSIHYASRIQQALLTSDDYIGKYLKEYFILFKPRDIVSGDFYWANEVSSSFLICAGDCTGHGVPGAFMSLLNISMLNEATLEKKLHSPEKILDDVRAHIIKALNPEGNKQARQDGMDCILASLTASPTPPKEGLIKLSYAAANNAPIIIRDGSSDFPLSGGLRGADMPTDKMPVGISPNEEKGFRLHTAELRKGDCVYLFTDGFADQFGGPKGKKFKHKQLSAKLAEISQQPMAEQKKALESIFEEWKGNLEQVDDVLVIGIRI